MDLLGLVLRRRMMAEAERRSTLQSGKLSYAADQVLE
jgi:hypothetical protein